MLKFFNILFLILLLNGCGNGETSHADGEPIASMANDGSYQLALDTSLTKFRLGFPCKYLAVSSNSTGQALAYVDSNWNVPILLYPGYSGLVDAKESLYVDVGPQPGKILQLFFGDEPIITSPAARFSTDPSIAILTQRFTLPSVTSQVLISAQNNVRGVKILGGTIVNFLFSSAGQKYQEANLSINTGATQPLISITIPSNTVSNYTQTLLIPQLYIPPNVELTFFASGAVAGSGFVYVFINYEIL